MKAYKITISDVHNKQDVLYRLSDKDLTIGDVKAQLPNKMVYIDIQEIDPVFLPNDYFLQYRINEIFKNNCKDDYPQTNSALTKLWVIEQSLEGLTKACNDWSKAFDVAMKELNEKPSEFLIKHNLI